MKGQLIDKEELEALVQDLRFRWYAGVDDKHPASQHLGRDRSLLRFDHADIALRIVAVDAGRRVRTRHAHPARWGVQFERRHAHMLPCSPCPSAADRGRCGRIPGG